MARRAVWTRVMHRSGLERPHFVATETVAVAPDHERSRQQEATCCDAVSSENPGGASEEGKNCSLRFWASLISSPNEAGSCQKRRGISDITDGKVAEKKRPNRAVATPLFG